MPQACLVGLYATNARLPEAFDSRRGAQRAPRFMVRGTRGLPRARLSAAEDEGEEVLEVRRTAAEMILVAKYALLWEREGGKAAPGAEAVEEGSGAKRRRKNEGGVSMGRVSGGGGGGAVIRAYGGGRSVAESAALAKVRDAAEKKRREALLAEAAMLAGSDASLLPMEPLVQEAPRHAQAPRGVLARHGEGGAANQVDDHEEGDNDDDDDDEVRPQMYDSDLDAAPGAQLEEEDQYGRTDVAYGHDEI